MRGQRALLAGVGAMLVAGMTPAMAQAAVNPACGSTLTVNTTLVSDVDCSGSNGYILSPGVTLNLGGHRLTGSAVGVGVQLPSAGFSSVINGRLDGWEQTINGTGFSGGTSVGFRLDKLHVVGGIVRLRMFDGTVAANTRVTNSTFEGGYAEFGGPGNAPGGAREIRVSKATLIDARLVLNSARVEDSTFTRSELYSRASRDGFSVLRSTFNGTGSSDLEAIACRGRTNTVDIRDSVITGYETGVMAYTCLTTVRNTTFRNNTTAIRTDTYGSTVAAERFTAIVNNDFTGNGTALSLAHSADVTGNVLTSNGVGISSEPGIYGQTIARNTVSRSTGTGITVGAQIDEPGVANNVTVRGNRSVRNGGQGIVVGVGSVDGGGNVASGNAVNPQCVGVVCSAS